MSTFYEYDERLLTASPKEAIKQLSSGGYGYTHQCAVGAEISTRHLYMALCNALTRIDVLEQQIKELKK